MSVSANRLSNKSQLRAEASFRLKIGVATGTNWALGTDTLGLLFKLASSPDTVMDGLKLLHELQTHQVELEMQHQELERCVQQHQKQQSASKLLFKAAPFGYLVVQVDGVIIQSNAEANRLLGFKSNSCIGQKFESFCTVLGAYGLQDLLKNAVIEGPPVVAMLELKAKPSRTKRIQLLVNRAPVGEHFLFGISSYDQLLKA